MHFDRLKLCPPNIRLNEDPNIHLNEELSGDQSTTDSQSLLPDDIQQTESSPVGQNLHIIDWDDEDVQNEADTTPTSMLPSMVPSNVAPSNRYPRREHRPPTRFNDFVAINCIKDETSS